MLKIGVLASGRGSNFQAVLDAIKAGKIKSEIKVLISDKANAFALERAKQNGIEALHISAKAFPSMDEYFVAVAEELKKRDIGLVLLAGFMRIVRRPLLDAFPWKVMNIHPALLPSFPGLHGQQQAVDYGARISGCTVHFVDAGMDTGPVIIQAAVACNADDTEDTLSERILKYEHIIYPEAVRLFAEGRLDVKGRKVFIKDSRPYPTDAIINPPVE
ncbi:MAG: phosphoribosylglycinamide formyltransferase [Nitrospiraceae bacterium]|nr:phosphoribosylglycinamide formyltransferase [Nitrospiraceae bacterium]